jgi:hypothetical protein
MHPLQRSRWSQLPARLHPALRQLPLGWNHSNLRVRIADPGSRNPATNLQEVDVSESLSALEKDLDSLLQFGGLEATACWGASGCFGASDLMITSISEGRFVHWRGMELFDLLEAEGRLVAHLEPLPFQEGRPLATVAEESTELIDASSDELVSRQVLMAEEGKDDGGFPIADFDAVSEDEATANAGDENDADREAQRARNYDTQVNSMVIP